MDAVRLFDKKSIEEKVIVKPKGEGLQKVKTKEKFERSGKSDFTIIGIKGHEVEFRIRYNDGDEGLIKSSTLKEQYPQKLLKYYR